MSGRTRSFTRTSNRAAIARLQAFVQGIDEEQLKIAVRRARVAMYRAGLPEANRDVRNRYGVKLGALRDTMRVVDGRSRKGDEYVAVEASARRISLLEFNGRWTRPGGGNLNRKRSKGAVASIAAGKRQAYAGAFIASIGWRGVSGETVKTDSVNRGIYVRRKKADGGRHGRGPVQLLRGPSPLEMLLGQDMRHAPKIAASLQAIYEAELVRQIGILLKRSGSRG